MAEREPRQQVADAGLTGRAIAVLTPMVTGVSLEALGVIKGLLKRYFSDEPWTDVDERALADAVGPGRGVSREQLAEGTWLVAGWPDGRFAIRIDVSEPEVAARPEPGPDLSETFRFEVVPEPTPNPRTLRFAVGPVTGIVSEGRDYLRGAEPDDPRVAVVMAVSNEISGVLIGPDFVSVSVDRPARWPDLLEAVLAAIAAAFRVEAAPVRPAAVQPDSGGVERARSQTKLEQAWAELGSLRPGDRPADLDRLLAAAASPDSNHRQVAANLLREAPTGVAVEHWSALIDDSSRAVRRAAVDAMADVTAGDVRPLLERAVRDRDGWIRWKAVRALADRGAVAASRAVLKPLLDDPDFRVRLEATRALSG